MRGAEEEEQRGGRRSVCSLAGGISSKAQGQWTVFAADHNGHRATSTNWNARYGWRSEALQRLAPI